MIKITAAPDEIEIENDDRLDEKPWVVPFREGAIRVRIGEPSWGAKLTFRWRDASDSVTVEVDRLSAAGGMAAVEVGHVDGNLIVEVDPIDSDSISVSRVFPKRKGEDES